jgi:drug/metabolite transporter (DMT)-like permease
VDSSDESPAGAVTGPEIDVPVPTGRAVLGVGYVLAAAGLFAVNGSLSKAVLSGAFSSLQLVEIRCLVASAVFAAVAFARRPGSLRMGRREIAFVTVYAIVGVALVQWLYFVSISRMPVSITLLIEFTAPVLIALWVRFVRRQSVHRRIWVALGLTVAGLALVAEVWRGLSLDAVGLLAAGAAAVSLATYYLLGEHGVGRRDPWSLAAWSFGVAGLFWILVTPPWRIPWRHLDASLPLGQTGLTPPTWLLVGYVVLLGTAAPFGLTLLALRRIGAGHAGLIATAEPPLAGLVAWPVLGEVLDTAQILGAVVVLAGIVLAETARRPVRIATAAVPPG